jgi:hypothetical protein
MLKTWIMFCLGFVTIASTATAEFPTFETITIDPHAGNIGYAVSVVDVDNDKKLDIVVVTENQVLWYQNGSWKKRVIISDQTPRDNVCIAPMDIDGDGKVDFAIGAGWTKRGTIHWVTRGKSLDEKWHVHSIGEEIWLHRMRWADVLGTGRPQLVVSPLNAKPGVAGTLLTAFEIPKNPKTERWPSVILSNEFNRVHNHWHVNIAGGKTIDTLTASREGVHVVHQLDDGFVTTKLGTGHQGTSANASGAGEIKTGLLGNKAMFITTVEPMHGHSLVLYKQPAKSKNTDLWDRVVLDDSLKRGHALWTGDLDKDGVDEIVIGHSDKGTGEVKGPGIYIFDAEDQFGNKWKKHILDDGGIATEDLTIADVNGDGWLDIVACGRATHNVKLYLNRGVK